MIFNVTSHKQLSSYFCKGNCHCCYQLLENKQKDRNYKTCMIILIQTCLPLFVKNHKMLEQKIEVEIKKIVRLFFWSQNAILSTETTHIVNGT